MAEKLEVPCAECDDRRRVLERDGYRVLTCEPKPDDDETCVLVYERAGAAAAQTTRGPKAKQATKVRPKPRTPAAKKAKLQKKGLTKAKTKTTRKSKTRKARKG